MLNHILSSSLVPVWVSAVDNAFASKTSVNEVSWATSTPFSMLCLLCRSTARSAESAFTSSVFLVLPVVALVAVIPRYLFEVPVQPAGAEPRH